MSLPVYVDDEANDLSDLGIGTSTASGKSSLSEDFDNNSVLVSLRNYLQKSVNHRVKNINFFSER